WMQLSYGPWLMWRRMALTRPAVTVFSRPKGLPIATTHWPTLRSSESPRLTGTRSLAPWISISAMSVFASRPTTLALNSLPVGSLTTLSSAFSTTWMLVRIKPAARLLRATEDAHRLTAREEIEACAQDDADREADQRHCHHREAARTRSHLSSFMPPRTSST